MWKTLVVLGSGNDLFFITTGTQSPVSSARVIRGIPPPTPWPLPKDVPVESKLTWSYLCCTFGRTALSVKLVQKWRQQLYITGALKTWIRHQGPWQKMPISDEPGMTMGLELGQKHSLMLGLLWTLWMCLFFPRHAVTVPWHGTCWFRTKPISCSWSLPLEHRDHLFLQAQLQSRCAIAVLTLLATRQITLKYAETQQSCAFACARFKRTWP